VYIFTPDGKQLGALPVDPNVNAIDIAARGEMLYLVNNKTNTYTPLTSASTRRSTSPARRYAARPMRR
jgi:hypothetical protein